MVGQLGIIIRNWHNGCTVWDCIEYRGVIYDRSGEVESHINVLFN